MYNFRYRNDMWEKDSNANFLISWCIKWSSVVEFGNYCDFSIYFQRGPQCLHVITNLRCYIVIQYLFLHKKAICHTQDCLNAFSILPTGEHFQTFEFFSLGNP